LRPEQQLSQDPAVLQAEVLASSGEYFAAAELLENSAAGKPAAVKQQFLLRAAEYRFLAADHDSATALLERLDFSDSPPLEFRKNLLFAELAIARNRPDEALDLLSAGPPDGVADDTRRRYYKDRSEAFRLSGNLLESGRELEMLDLMTNDQIDKLDNQLDIIRTYAALSDNLLQQLQPPPPNNQGGWMELTRIIKSHFGNEQQIKAQLPAWRKRYPDHPVMPELLDGYFSKLKGLYRKPSHLAVLLPESGPYARVASLLRDGLLAAYFEEKEEERPRLYFYDSSNSDQIWPLYLEAVELGADMVIGPLDKEGVAQLNRVIQLEVPVLALNQVASNGLPSPDLFQFGLSPEDEATQVADRAWTDGHTVAAVLTPTGDWGDRIAAAFRQRWEELGGILAEHQQYDEQEHDFSTPIQALLNIDQSNQRHKELQQLLGRSLEFEPRRRADIGFIFMAAKVQKARQLRPQLLFHHAADLPVYTTSHVFGGVASVQEDQDLNGIRFPIIPWLATATDGEFEPLSLQQLLQVFPNTSPSYFPLLAMGIDSYQLIPHLARLQANSREIFEGKTGNVYMDRSNYLRRQLLWAEMVNGVPQITGFSPRLDSTIGAFPEAPVENPNDLTGPSTQPLAPNAAKTNRRDPI